jgi:hypothetical protein
MLNLGQGTGNAGVWEALTQGTQGKKADKSAAPYLLRVSAQFLLLELRSKILIKLKFKWGQSVAWLKFGANLCSVTCRNFRLCFSGSIINPQLYTT